MKKFDELTNLQKEYFYASGTVLSCVALGFIVPPVALLSFVAAGIGIIAIASVAIMEARSKATVKADK